MNYEDMSDFEINKAVSRLVDFGDLIVTVNDGNEVVYLCDKDGFFDMVPISHFDPCNNPSDAWPIIVENTISLTRCISSGNKNWHADFIESIEEVDGDDNLFSCETSCNYYHENPLRAAMICFLKMKDVEK